MIKSLIREYGLPWIFNRSLYSAKLKLLRAIPSSESLFETKVKIKRINIFELNHELLEDFLSKLSLENKEEIISIADDALEGKILGFSSIQLDYGYPIRWHYSPITKKEVDKDLKWYQISDFDSERGDIKAIWEASRLTHFFYFVRAYMLTKNEKYYNAFSDQLKNWLQENKYSYGPNYKCGQEASLRMINALITYSAFKLYGLTDSSDEENLVQLIGDSYKKILSNFFYAHKCIRNNHTLSEITGLIIGAWASKDNKGLKNAYILLDKEIQKQFLPDGGYLQYSFNYQRFALQIAEFVMKISEKTKHQISDQSKKLIKNSAQLLYQLQDQSGDVPNYGSNDGALIFPVTACGYRDFRPIVNTIFAIVDGKRIFNSGSYDEEIIWFGTKEPRDYPVSLIEKKTEMFEASGLYSLRHSGGFLMTILQGFESRPAQMDQLHIDLWHNGVNVFCDSGSYSYASGIGKEMSLTSAHNTVKVDGKEQMKKREPFLVYDWSRRNNVTLGSDCFKGTMISKNGYEHTRSIKKTKQGYSIIDEVIGGGEYCDFYFHTPCKVKNTEKSILLYNDDQVIANVKTDGEIEVKKAFRSLYYLKKEEVNLVFIRVKMKEKKCNNKIEIILTER
ncbi:heparinase II/III family protein [Halobacillus sp. GSS1]|uniref:heparinase II/III domain-containing protein n=1 Tax=Halobacillus sp. GSS1 TaxID=2815919 RepID=UPI001A8EA0A9|nr:heparinase II/III family protein [Halobacillus sp. GSS1]MBN9655055.1 heparinase II/III family protein [Halobacillus sp. GSS1]